MVARRRGKALGTGFKCRQPCAARHRGGGSRAKVGRSAFGRGVQRFAKVAIVPRPSKRWSAVTRVRSSTRAVAAKKRSAGSW